MCTFFFMFAQTTCFAESRTVRITKDGFQSSYKLGEGCELFIIPRTANPEIKGAAGTIFMSAFLSSYMKSNEGFDIEFIKKSPNELQFLAVIPAMTIYEYSPRNQEYSDFLEFCSVDTFDEVLADYSHLLSITLSDDEKTIEKYEYTISIDSLKDNKKMDHFSMTVNTDDTVAHMFSVNQRRHTSLPIINDDIGLTLLLAQFIARLKISGFNMSSLEMVEKSQTFKVPRTHIKEIGIAINSLLIELEGW